MSGVPRLGIRRRSGTLQKTSCSIARAPPSGIWGPSMTRSLPSNHDGSHPTTDHQSPSPTLLQTIYCLCSMLSGQLASTALTTKSRASLWRLDTNDACDVRFWQERESRFDCHVLAPSDVICSLTFVWCLSLWWIAPAKARTFSYSVARCNWRRPWYPMEMPHCAIGVGGLGH
jgi:hypothetical protein